MRFKLQVIAFATFLTFQPQSWGQTKAADSAAESYSEQLKAASTADNNDSSQQESESSRDAYKNKLRRLAGDSEPATNGKAQDAGAVLQKNIPAARVPEDSVARNPEADHSVRQVSTQDRQTEPEAHVTNASEPVAPPSTCSDSYCQHLKQVANGGEQVMSNSLVTDGRNLTTERNFIKNLAFDQVHIWESPFKLRDYDATWAVPFAILTGSLIDTDRDVSRQLAKPSRQNISKQISDAGLFGSIGVGAGFYGLGLVTHDEHKRETGLLSGEAFINATLVAEALKLAVGRQRPFQDNSFGHIGKGGSSFPSEHAIGTFAIASVIAREYPNPFVEIGAYGLASAVAATRVTAGQHFPSDVLVGGAFGYLIGRKIYNDHHNPELEGAEYGTFVQEHKYDAAHSGSAYVPLESWVYPVIDRLAALGYVHSNFDSERPFTRLECARLAAEAAGSAGYDDVPADVRDMVDSLQREFSHESEILAGESPNRSAELESVYSRITEIAGPVLRDGYHFGQTLYNDYGRPYGRGLNDIAGFSARATSGPLVFYFRGEYQRAPGNPGYTPQQQSLMFQADSFKPEPTIPFPAVDRFQVLDAYVGLTLNNNLLTLGQQSLWWGPGTDGPFMLSDNAAPLKMIRLSSVSPVEIPVLSRFLGPLRYDAFFGQTDGEHYVLSPRGLVGPNPGTEPFVQGQRFTFKPTENFELGFTKTGVFGGSGYPLTAEYLFRTTFTTANYEAGAAQKPGDRRSGVDLTYRVPRLRNWVTWYAEAFSEDEVSPLFFPRSSAMRSGVYAARLPGLPHVDLRVEGVYTDIPGYGQNGTPGYFYFNATYKSGFTNDGDLMGSWIGREGRGINANSTVWLTSKSSLQLGYREAVVDHEFLDGGRYQDESLKGTFWLRPDLQVSTTVQIENWRFPLLAPGLQDNVSSSISVTYVPRVRR